MPAGSGPRSRRRATAGAASSIASRGHDGRGSSARSAFVDLDDVRRRRDALEVELADLLDVVEDAGELAAHPLDLLVGELEAREPRDVQDLVAIDHACRWRSAALGCAGRRRVRAAGPRASRGGLGCGGAGCSSTGLGAVRSALVAHRAPAADGDGQRRRAGRATAGSSISTSASPASTPSSAGRSAAAPIAIAATTPKHDGEDRPGRSAARSRAGSPSRTRAPSAADDRDDEQERRRTSRASGSRSRARRRARRASRGRTSRASSSTASATPPAAASRSPDAAATASRPDRTRGLQPARPAACCAAASRSSSARRRPAPA